jgi:tetratricopeptide (TPR) repeat protein
MAGQVNTRFVFILSTVLVVLVGAIVLVAYMASRDAEELANRGEQFLAEGEHKLAAETLKRAVNHSKSDPAIIQRYIEVCKQVPAADQVEAGNTMDIVRAWTLNLAQVDPSSEVFLRDYADLTKFMISKIRTNGNPHPFLRYIHAAALARLESMPDDKLARRYRGIYGLLLLNAEMTESEINLVRDDLVWAQQTYPDDPEVTLSVARWKLFEANRLDRPGGDAARAQVLRDEAIGLTQGLVDAEPDNIMRLVNHMQVVHQAKFRAQDRDDPYEEVRPILGQVETRLLEKPEPFQAVSIAMQYIKAVYAIDLGDEESTGDIDPIATQGEGVKHSIAMLNRAVEVHPDDPRYRLMLGVELKLASEFEQARSHLDHVRGLSTQGDYLDVLLNFTLKSAAEIEYADLLVSLAQFAEEDAEREAMYAEADRIIEQLTAAGRGEQPRILLLKGRLALAQSKVREGLVSIDKAAELYDAFSREKAEALLLSARARAQQGDWGSAAERYEQLLEANPNIPVVRLTLAGIYVRQRQFDVAQDHLDAVLMDDPQNERAKVVQASIYEGQGDLDRAIQTYRELDLPNRPDLALGLAQLMIKGDRRDQAVAMLQHYFDADPTDLRMLSTLLGAEQDPDKRMQLIARSREAGGDPSTLDMLEQQLDPELAGDLDRMVQIATERQDDPFLREIGAAQLYARGGDTGKAREALARAAKIDPDHKAVIDMQFNYALSDGDMALAQRLADRAAQGNLDEASGRFYQAQILKAKGDYSGAIDMLRAALDTIPINSEGWRLLGDMYIANNNTQDAVTAYETSLKQKPDNLASMRGLAAIRDRQGRRAEALEMLRVGRLQYPDNRQLVELYLVYEGRYGDKQLALRLRRELQRRQPQNTGNLRALAILLAETGQPDQAEEVMSGLMAGGDTVPVNVLAMATVHRFAGQPERGAQEVRRYILSRGSEVGAVDHLMLARYLIEVQDSEGALNAYQQAILIEGDQREASRELAGLYFSRGIFDRATALYRDLFTQFPEEQLIGLRLADSQIRTQQFEEAAEVLSGLEDGSTKDALGALIAAQRGDHEEAIRLVTRAIEQEPGKAMFYYERAALNAQDPELTDEVIHDLNTALSLDPDHQLSRRLLVGMYQRRGERNEAIRELTNLVSRHPEHSESRLMLVRMYVQDGNLTRAGKLVRQAIERSDTAPTWHAVLGDLKMREGDTADAIKSYARVFELAPNPGQLLKLATIQIENGQAGDAQALLRENADMVNAQPLLQSLMGRALFATGKTDQARQVFIRAAERSASLDQLFGVSQQVRKDYTLEETASLLQNLAQPPAPAWVDLTLSRLELSDGLVEQAISRLETLEKVLSTDNIAESQALDQVMAPALHQMGESKRALSYYERLIEVTPENVSVLNNMAYLLAEDLDRPGDALPLAQRAAEINPKNAQVLDTLGWIQFKLGQIDSARQTLEDSIAVEGLTANHLHLAELLIDQGYRAEGERHLKTVIDLAEQNNETEALQRARELLEPADELTEAM